MAGVAERQLKSSSSMCQTGCRYTPLASIATCVTRYAASQTRNASRPYRSLKLGQLRRTPPGRGRDAHARRQLRPVHIERADALKDRLRNPGEGPRADRIITDSRAPRTAEGQTNCDAHTISTNRPFDTHRVFTFIQAH